MNATMINNREYVETQHHFSSKIDQELLEKAGKFYREPLSDIDRRRILSMDLIDKLWLLQQYKDEEKIFPPADFDNIY